MLFQTTPHQQQQYGFTNLTAQQQQTPAQISAHQFAKDSDDRSIFIGNLPKGDNGGYAATPEDILTFFADCGQIINCTVLKDRNTGQLKGTAYVEFASHEMAGRALDIKQNANFQGSTIFV